MDIFQKVELRQKTKCAQTLVLYSRTKIMELFKKIFFQKNEKIRRGKKVCSNPCFDI